MTLWTLIRRSLRFHARAHMGVVLGAAIGSAALVGALVVGDSVRGSLRERALLRLAGAHFALAPVDRLFRWDWARMELKGATGNGSYIGYYQPGVRPSTVPPGTHFSNRAALLALPATATIPSVGARANRVMAYGVDDDFWRLARATASIAPQKDQVVLNQALAAQLGAQTGDEVILRIERLGSLSRESALTPKSHQSAALRLKVVWVAPPESGADLNLRGQGAPAMNAFIGARQLAEAVGLDETANVLLTREVEHLAPWTPPKAQLLLESFWNRFILRRNLVVRRFRSSMASTEESLQALNAVLWESWALKDSDLKLERAGQDSVLSSLRVFLDPPIMHAATQVEGSNCVAILTYLANLISSGSNATPYSMVTAAGPPYTPPDMRENEIVLNQWLADDLGAKPGDSVDLSYFRPESGAQLLEATNRFRVHSIAPMEMPWADRTLLPAFPGIEKAESTRDWDAGFPLAYKIRPKDEDYWKKYRGTPKAFITLAAGQKMWANRFGSLTAIRFPNDSHFIQKFLATLDPADLGLHFEPVREQALKAAEQGQDFGQLFLGFSLFLIAAALLLTALLFQFGLELRAEEVGTFLALGFTPKQVRRLFLREGAALALLGGIVGTLGGIAYARAMLLGLATVWRNAVGPSVLQFHVTALSLLLGATAGFIVSVVVMWWTLRRQAKQPVRELLVGCQNLGAPASPLASPRHKLLADGDDGAPRLARIVSVAACTAALGTVLWALAQNQRANAEAFFSAGSLLLISGLGFASARLAALARQTTTANFTLGRLGLRGCGRRRNRSLATIALLASGSFVIASIGVFRLDANADAARRASGTGGFALIGDSTVPVVQDLNTERGREFFGLGSNDLAGVNVVPFRLHEGDDASCLNLNRAQKPRVLGVRPDSLSGRFTFTSVARGLDRSQGWALLQQSKIENLKSEIDEVAAIGDANSIQWALGKSVGDTLDYSDERGRTVKLRIVGAIANSVLQGSLIIDEQQFLKLFPNESGYRFFLLDAPSNAVASVSATLSRALQDVGLELTPTARRLNAFNAVQNTYLGTFQVLGGLGLLLGSAGLGIVVLRNVLERRSELALLVAVGFRRRLLERLVLSEHGALLGLGLALGVIAAAVAVLPNLLSPGAKLPYGSFGLTLGAVLANGAVWTWGATRYALRGNLLEALRKE